MPPVLRRFALVAAALTALLGVLAGVALALAGGWQRERLREWLARLASDATGLEISIGALEGPLYPHFGLREVRASQGSHPLFELAELRVRYGLREILRSRLAIESLSLVSPQLDLQRDERGAWGFGLPETGTSTRPATLPLELALGSIEVHDARFALRWELPDGPGYARGGFDARGRSLVLRRDASLAAPARMTAELRLDEAQLAALGLPGRWAGGARLELDVRAGASILQGAISADVELAADDLVAGGASRIELRGRVQAGNWEIDSARARTPLGNAELQGSGDLQRIGRLAGSAQLPELRPFSLWLGDGPPVEGSGRLDFELRGAWGSPEGAVALELRELRVRGVEIGSLDLALASRGDRRIDVERLALSGPDLQLESEAGGSIALDERAANFDSLRLRSGAQRLALSGRVGRERFAGFALDLSDLELEPLLALAGSSVPARGRVSGRIRLDGPLSRPAIDVQGRWSGARFADLAIERVDFRAETGEGRIRAGLSLADPQRGALQAELATPFPPPADLQALLASRATRLAISTPGFDLAGVGSAAAIPLPEGRLSGDLELRGRPGLPELLGSLHLVGAGVDASLRFAPDALEIEQLRFGEAGEPSLSARATLAAEASGEIAIRIDALRVESAGWQAWTDAPGQLRLRGAELSVERLRLGTTAGSLELEGRLHRERIGALRVRSEALEVAPLARLAGLADPLEGTLAADLRLEGPYPLPSLDGWLEWTSPGYLGVRADLARVSLRTGDALLRGDLWLRVDGEQPLRADWTIPYRAPLRPAGWLGDPATAVSLRAQQLDLRWLAPLQPRFVRDPQGVLDALLELRGRAGGPELEGHMQLSDGSLAVPALRQTYAPIRGSAVLSSDALAIESLELGSESGSARLSGSIGLVGGVPGSADLRLRAQELRLGGERGLSAQVDGDLALAGPLEALALRGSLQLARGRLSLSEAEDRLMREIRVRGLPDEEPARDARAHSLVPALAELDLEIEVQRNSWIRAAGAALDVEGTLRVRRSPAGEAGYAGTLRVARGSYRVQGREFEIRSGAATFTGGPELDPRIEATGVYRVRGIEIVASLRGRVSAPRVELSSRPPLPQDDILSYLAFGRSRSELQGTAGGADLGGTAAALAGGVAAQELSEELRDLLAVDVLDIQLDESTGTPDAAIGKYVTDDVFVRFGRDLRIEWSLTPSLRIESEVSPDETSGADLIWQHDY